MLYRIHDQYHIASDPSLSFSSLILLRFDLRFIRPVFILFSVLFLVSLEGGLDLLHNDLRYVLYGRESLIFFEF